MALLTRTAQTDDRKVDRLLRHYGESHRHPTNERIHMVAVPAIMFSLLGLSYAVHPLVAYALVAASLVYYATLQSAVFLMSMAIVSAVFMLGVHMLGPLAWPVSALIFVVAWVFQFVGHRIEGRKPSFLEDVRYLWIGPLFVLSRLFLRWQLRW